MQFESKKKKNWRPQTAQALKRTHEKARGNKLHYVCHYCFFNLFHSENNFQLSEHDFQRV